MPVLDGLSATKILRGRGVSLPIIALTANSTMEDKKQCFAAGMDECISKPYKLAQIKQVLAHYQTEVFIQASHTLSSC